jgi:hypothetical protein
MFFLKMLILIFILGIGGGIAYVAYSDVPVPQQTVTKTIPNDGIINAE